MAAVSEAELVAVLRWINAERGTAYSLHERFPEGTEGAWRVTDAAGTELVLKFETGPRDLGPLPAVLETLARLGARGYPVPRYLAVGVHPHAPRGRYTLQERLPGDVAPRIDHALLDQILVMNDLQAGLGLPQTAPPEGWREHLLRPILEDDTGPAARRNDGLRRYSPETAALLECLRDYVRHHAQAPMAAGDVVHFDFSKDHIWTEIWPDPQQHCRVRAGKITGIIDFEGLVTGDRVFDLVTMLFYNYGGPAYRAGPTRRMWDRACELAGPATVGLYLAHIVHRQVGACVRWHTAASTRHHLDKAATALAELEARSGYRLLRGPVGRSSGRPGRDMKIYRKSEESGAGPAWVCGHWNGSPIQIGMGRRTEVGAGEVRHHHPYREYYVVIDGAAELEVEGTLVPLRAGMVVLVEPGERHRVAAVGEAGAHWVVIKERSEPDTKHVS